MARPRTRTSYYALEGGLDIVSPALTVKSGKALAMVNFEPWYQGGYRRIPGYERFDGRPRPSDASFTGFEVDDVSSLSLRDVVTGDSSSTTGVVVGIWDDDGTYGSDWIAVTKVSGSGFVDAETCNTAAFTIGNDPLSLAAPNSTLKETWLLEAELDYREDIAVVPGANQVRGAWQRLADAYAVRDNVGVTAGILHVASAAGWVTTGITMADTIPITTAVGDAIAEGDTITGVTSTETATVHRVIVNGGSGAWDASGEGYLVVTGATGAFNAAEALQVSAVTLANTTATNTTFALPVGGVYRFTNHNFFGGAATYRTYGVNGVGVGFEIDENKIVSPIFMPTNAITDAGTPPSTNVPFLIEEHRGHLFMMFPGGSLQHSVPGEPLNFSSFLGAGEFGLGDEGTSLNSVVGNVLIASTRRQTRGLFGTGVTDWDLRIVAEQSGSSLYGSQKIDTVYSLDDLGITSVSRTDQFGDFISATVSKQVQPIVIAKRPIFTDSTIVRESNQFRLYFSDKSCLVMYVPAGTQTQSIRTQKTSTFSQFGLLSYDIPVTLIYNTDDETGKERTYFVTDDATFEGYVFEDQIGKNFDGEVIPASVRTVFNQIGSPTYRKYFRRADLELNAPNKLTLKFNSDLTYGEARGSGEDIDILGSGGFFDTGTWDEIVFDGKAISTARAELRGTGENVGFLIFNESAVSKPWVMQGVTIHYDMRRLQR